MTTTTQPKLTPAKIKAILRRHKVTNVEIARQLGIAPANISKWFANQTVSNPIESALTAKALELLEQEQTSVAS